ncbi:MAG: glycosyltransferase family 4 protein [Synergistaceae bacterium]|nr:glycosyltransferase family 4 protein [Synergistaceae bacterium]MBQ3448822.1 glycosyltransferase family 4 protein [Synergistaceae bacterium]
MHKFCEYDSFVTSYPDIELPRLKNTPGLRVERVPDITGKWLEDSCLWLKDNAKRIDVLNLYHLAPRSIRQALTYKLHNPKGKVYLKFDGTPMPRRFKFWKNIKPYIMLSMCKIVSTELQENAEILSRKWHRKIICVPNPLNPGEIKEYKSFSERSNTILTVGRLGTQQKATEILLEAFAKIADKIPNWKLKLAGAIRENMNIADDFFAKYPDMKERVIFTEHIEDREELIEIYRDSKIFAFPSRWESFGIALTEAMMNGCFCVASRIPSSMSLTENFSSAMMLMILTHLLKNYFMHVLMNQKLKLLPFREETQH